MIELMLTELMLTKLVTTALLQIEKWDIFKILNKNHFYKHNE